jgi:hypothetical protein
VHNITNAIKGIPGGFHTCAILSDHTVQCWGRNQDGQMGNGDSTTDVALPAPVIGLGPVADLAGGGYHNCALMPDTTVRCWGRNGRGQVGDGTVNTPIVSPHPVSGLNSVVTLSLGGYHSCALRQDATVQCWGQSEYGQIGAPGLAFSSTPVTVLANAVSVGTGFRHSCALLADGTARCWGHNTFGQLGDGTTTDSSTPVQVQGITNALAIHGGEGHTCALMPDKSVLCWGENDYGELGIGTTTNSLTPVKMHTTGLVWTSSDPSVATVSSTGLVTAAGIGTATMTATDGFGNSGSTTVAVHALMTLGVMRQGDGGGTVTSSPAGVNCGTTCSASFVNDSQVTLTAATATDSNFTGWTGCDSVSGATCTVAMTNARTVSAIFMLKRFTLAAARTGLGVGTVTSSPAGINCGSSCSSDYVINTAVALTASPAANSVFVGWSGCDSVSGATCNVLMSSAKSVTANFDLKRFTLSVTISRTLLGNGTVTSSPTGINCGADCSEAYVIGTGVTLTATSALGSVFTGWTGCDAVNGASCTVSMNAAKSVSASFVGVPLF